MTFYTGKMFPAKYQGGIFVASRGSWTRTKPTGALIDFVSPKADGTTDKHEVFAAGRAKAQACAVCPGTLGLSVTPDAPHLAGQPAIYVAAQLSAYRSGARKHEVMAVMAKPLTDDDILNLAAWFNSIRVEATAP